jgi:hypothetical protein
MAVGIGRRVPTARIRRLLRPVLLPLLLLLLLLLLPVRRRRRLLRIVTLLS